MKTTTFDFFWFFAPLKNEFAFIVTSLELAGLYEIIFTKDTNYL